MSEETKNTTAETTSTVTLTKKSTWVNRICSAVAGVIVGVLGMFGITTDQINTEKAKVISVKSQATAALEALKAGDVTTATANLQAAIATGKEVVADAKAVAEKVKETDKASILETAKGEITKTVVADQVKKVEQAAIMYSADLTKVKTEKKTETTVKTDKKTSEKETTKPVSTTTKK